MKPIEPGTQVRLLQNQEDWDPCKGTSTYAVKGDIGVVERFEPASSHGSTQVLVRLKAGVSVWMGPWEFEIMNPIERLARET